MTSPRGGRANEVALTRIHLTGTSDARWNPDETPRAPLASGPDLVFLSRDGRIRTHDLSVPNADHPIQHVFVWTNTQVLIGGETRGDGHGWLRTRDKRGMEVWSYMFWLLGDHPFCFSATTKPNGARPIQDQSWQFLHLRSPHNAGYGRGLRCPVSGFMDSGRYVCMTPLPFTWSLPRSSHVYSSVIRSYVVSLI